jgi:hypothetical protein
VRGRTSKRININITSQKVLNGSPTQPETTLSYCSANFTLDEEVEPFGPIGGDYLDVPIGLISASRRHRALKQSQTSWSSDR